MKVEAIEYGDRRVYSVASFNRGIADWLTRLPTVWVEGEVTELRRQARWQSVFLTLKDPDEGSCLAVTMPRGQFDALRLDLANGERVHVYGRPELFEARGDFRLRALSIERFGLGDHLAALERLKQKLAAEGLFDTSRKRQLPRLPRRVGLVTGNDAAAKKDVIAAITARFPPARLLVAETYVQGPRRRRSQTCCRRSRKRTRSTSSSWPEEAAASKTSSPSATSGSCARSPPARCRSSPRSDTSRTHRSPTWSQTPGRRRQRPRRASSSRTWPTSRPASSDPGPPSQPERAEHSSASAEGSTSPATTSAAHRFSCSNGDAQGSPQWNFDSSMITFEYDPANVTSNDFCHVATMNADDATLETVLPPATTTPLLV